MNIETLKQYLPSRMPKWGKTYFAVKLHFIEGYPITESAKMAGISRQAASLAIKKIRESLYSDGYIMKYRKIVQYERQNGANSTTKPDNLNTLQ